MAFDRKAAKAAGYSDAEIDSYLSSKRTQDVQRVDVPGWRGGVMGGIAQGAWDPIQGGAQFLSHITPSFIADPLNNLNNWVAQKTGLFDPVQGGNLDQMVTQNEQAYQQARADSGRSGFDAARLVGNIVSPANLGAAKALPIGAGASIPSLAGKGALYGAIGGAAAPVAGGDYATQKAAQIGLGAATGAVLTPIITKVGQAVSNRVNGMIQRGRRAANEADAERIIREALRDTQQKITDLPDDYLATLKTQVVDSLKSGKKLDAAALMRQQDFRKLGMEGTLGQITRDPAQYAAERNLRGVAGVGEPLLSRLEQQNRGLQDIFANQADEAYQAGTKAIERLASIDNRMSSTISKAYETARQSAGAKQELNLTGLAQDYADVLFRFGDKVPSGIRNQFEQYGLMSGQQMKLMTVDNADQLIKAINEQVGSDKASNAALAYLRNAVKKAVTDNVDDVFSAGRKLASQRFALQDAVPALKAASEGTASPDSFIQKYIIGGKTNEVAGLSKLLKGTPQYDEARQQIIQHMQRAAFGENPAGDAAFSATRYAKVLRQFGDTKLSHFFTPQEIDLFKTAGRVGAYINSHPVASPVNTSNTGALVANLLRHSLGWTHIGQIADSVSQPVKNRMAVTAAMEAKVPAVSGLTAEQMQFINTILGGGAIGSASFASQ